MKKSFLVLLTLILLFTVSIFSGLFNNTQANAASKQEEYKALLGEYFDMKELQYTKYTNIYLNEASRDELLANSGWHADVDTLNRVTFYDGDALWMSREDGKYSYYGTSYDEEGHPNGVTNGTATEPLVKPSKVNVVLSGTGKNSMNEYYVGLEDIAALDVNKWSNDGKVYSSNDPEVLELFKAFVAPCYVGFSNETVKNFITLSEATISTNASGDLVLQLHAAGDEGKFTSGSDVFAQAVIKSPLANGKLVWDENTIKGSVVAHDFVKETYPADLSVVEVDGRNALQVKYQEGFFNNTGEFTTPGIQFIGNNVELSEKSVVTFYVRANDEWSVSNNHAGIYIFYDGVECGKISTSGSLWNGTTASGERDRYLNNNNKIEVMNIFANATIGDKQWVKVTITFEGIENPDLANLSIAYGLGDLAGGHSLKAGVAGHENSWIYISDVEIESNELDVSKGIVWDESNVNAVVNAHDFVKETYPADLSVVEVDGRNALQVKYQEGFFNNTGEFTTPGIQFIGNNVELSEKSVVTFYVRANDEWSVSNNHAGIYIFYDGVECGKISTSGSLWNGTTASGERDRYLNNNNKIEVMNIFANATIGDKQWVKVTITFEGIENPDLANLSIAYGLGDLAGGHSLKAGVAGHENSWIYISDITIS